MKERVREFCRGRNSLNGVDAQALEHALTITEAERDRLAARVKELMVVLRIAKQDIWETARANQANINGVDLAIPEDKPCEAWIGNHFVHQAGVTQSLSIVTKIETVLAELWSLFEKRDKSQIAQSRGTAMIDYEIGEGKEFHCFQAAPIAVDRDRLAAQVKELESEKEHYREQCLVAGETIRSDRAFFHGCIAGLETERDQLHTLNSRLLGEGKRLNAELSKRYVRGEELRREHAAEVDEFNRGRASHCLGVAYDAEPSGQWRIGWAWAAFDGHVKRIAELEAALREINGWLRPISCTCEGQQFEVDEALRIIREATDIKE